MKILKRKEKTTTNYNILHYIDIELLEKQIEETLSKDTEKINKKLLCCYLALPFLLTETTQEIFEISKDKLIMLKKDDTLIMTFYTKFQVYDIKLVRNPKLYKKAFELHIKAKQKNIFEFSSDSSYNDRALKKLIFENLPFKETEFEIPTNSLSTLKSAVRNSPSFASLISVRRF